MDNKQIAVGISAPNNADMNIVRIKYQITRERIVPWDRGAVVVLGHGSTTVADDVTTICGVIEYPIDEPAAI